MISPTQQFITQCSALCGRQVIIPPMLLKANINGGKINILCKKCSRDKDYYNCKIKGRP